MGARRHLGPKRTGQFGQMVVITGHLCLAVRARFETGSGNSRRGAGCGRREFRRGPAAGVALVSAKIPGRGAGHRRRRQHGRGAGFDVRAVDRRVLWLAGGVRRVTDSAGAGVCAVHRDGQGCARAARAGDARRLHHGVQGCRYLVVHVLLLHHLRRFRRSRQRAAVVLHLLVSHLRYRRRPHGGAGGVRRFHVPADWRPARGSHRRPAQSANSAGRGGAGLYYGRSAPAGPGAGGGSALGVAVPPSRSESSIVS